MSALLNPLLTIDIFYIYCFVRLVYYKFSKADITQPV